jgi:hypothetical protein
METSDRVFAQFGKERERISTRENAREELLWKGVGYIYLLVESFFFVNLSIRIGGNSPNFSFGPTNRGQGWKLENPVGSLQLVDSNPPFYPLQLGHRHSPWIGLRGAEAGGFLAKLGGFPWQKSPSRAQAAIVYLSLFVFKQIPRSTEKSILGNGWPSAML